MEQGLKSRKASGTHEITMKIFEEELYIQNSHSEVQHKVADVAAERHIRLGQLLFLGVVAALRTDQEVLVPAK